jgi:hypothetical protein
MIKINDVEYLDLNEASLYLGYSNFTFTRQKARFVKNKHTINGKNYFSKEDLDNYIEQIKKQRTEKLLKRQIYSNDTLAQELNLTTQQLRSFKIIYKNVYNIKLPTLLRGQTTYTEKDYNIIKKAYLEFENIRRENKND